MRRRSITFFGTVLSVALASCGGGSATSTDAGSDTSSDGGSGTSTDGGSDASSDGTTAMTDTGPVVGCAVTYAGCTTRTTTDDTASGYFEIGIITSCSSPPQYSEPCVRIRAGQTLGIAAGTGDPLAASSCTPAGILPLPTMPGLGTMNYTFTTPGNYGYYSTTHGADNGSGMSGLIVVE